MKPRLILAWVFVLLWVLAMVTAYVAWGRVSWT